MKGCRPLTKREVRKVKRHFTGRFKVRNYAMFMLGIHTGFRISEMLSLRIRDVLDKSGRPMKRVTVPRRHMKKKIEGRTILLHPKAGVVVKAWIKELARLGYLEDDSLLFQSQAAGNRAIGRSHAFRILIEAFMASGMSGRLGTHSLRKTFAQNIAKALKGDLLLIQKALGHADINNTVKYLSCNEEEIDKAIMDNS